MYALRKEQNMECLPDNSVDPFDTWLQGEVGGMGHTWVVEPKQLQADLHLPK